MKILSLKLEREAKLLGSWSFILKAAVAMFFAFSLGRYIPLANRDMISFLFAMMLSLEPISSTGFKRGLDQFRATLIGGLMSGLIVAIVGINPLGLALSIAVILYFTLAQDWRNLSVVALFTGIYMTQFLQLQPDGRPDILLTMMVRILALSSGIGFAMIFNALVSIGYMRHLPQSRLSFLNYRIQKHIQRLLEKLDQSHVKAPHPAILPLRDHAHLSMANLFNDIDWNTQLLRDLASDPLLKLGGLTKDKVDSAIKHTEALRRFSHYLFDLELQLRCPEMATLSDQEMYELVQVVKHHLFHFSKDDVTLVDTSIPIDCATQPQIMQRIFMDLEACQEAFRTRSN